MAKYKLIPTSKVSDELKRAFETLTFVRHIDAEKFRRDWASRKGIQSRVVEIK